MTNEEYIKRIEEADGDPEKMFVAQGERMGTLHAQTQTDVGFLRREVAALREQLDRIEALLTAHLREHEAGR